MILSKDTVVAVWQNEELKVLKDALLPLYLKRASNAKAWLEARAIDSHRANSHLLKKALIPLQSVRIAKHLSLPISVVLKSAGS